MLSVSENLCMDEEPTETSTGSTVITINKSLKAKDKGWSREQAKPLRTPWGSMDYFW